MNTDRVNTLWDYFEVIRRRWVWSATLVPLAVISAVLVAYAIEPSYRASGTILLEPSSIPSTVVPTTVNSYVDQRIEIVRRRVMTGEKLMELVAADDPYPDLDISPAEKAALISQNTEIERVDPVTLETLLVSTAFSIHYSNPNPYRAAQVADKLVELFLTYNQKTRAEEAAGTYEFLLAQSKKLEQEAEESEARLAEFKKRNFASLPEDQIRNQAALERAEREMDSLQREIRVLQEQESLLALQLNQINPHLFDPAGDWQKELAALRTELAVAQQKYTPDHPDVKRLLRSIQALSARAGTSASAAPPDNPEYLRVASQLQGARNQLAALRANAARASTQIQQSQARLSVVPTVESEYANLVRDREMAQDKLKELESKLQDAEIAEKLETQQRGERFTLIRPPFPPKTPFSPNRLGIILIGIILGAGLAVGISAFLESTDPTVRSRRDLADVAGFAVIGSVPFLRNDADRRYFVRAWAVGGVILAVGLAAAGYTVVTAISRTQLNEVAAATTGQ